MRDYRIVKPEFLQVKTRDGFAMEAMMIKPPDFDPSKKYPVYEYTYSGPHAPQVRNAWGGRNYALVPAPRQARHRGVGVRQPQRQRQGDGVGVDVLQAHGRAGAASDLEDGLKWLDVAAVRRRLARDARRLELRRIHDRRTR